MFHKMLARQFENILLTFIRQIVEVLVLPLICLVWQVGKGHFELLHEFPEFRWIVVISF